jgi:hypothetical protein
MILSMCDALGLSPISLIAARPAFLQLANDPRVTSVINAILTSAQTEGHFNLDVPPVTLETLTQLDDEWQVYFGENGRFFEGPPYEGTFQGLLATLDTAVANLEEQITELTNQYEQLAAQFFGPHAGTLFVYSDSSSLIGTIPYVAAQSGALATITFADSTLLTIPGPGSAYIRIGSDVLGLGLPMNYAGNTYSPQNCVFYGSDNGTYKNNFVARPVTGTNAVYFQVFQLGSTSPNVLLNNYVIKSFSMSWVVSLINFEDNLAKHEERKRKKLLRQKKPRKQH